LIGPNSAGVASLQPVPRGQVLAVTQDTLLEAVHFFAATPAFEVGYKSAAANLSDLASMGAAPAWLNVVVHGQSRQHITATASHAWLRSFEHGFTQACAGQGILLTLATSPAPALRITVVAGGHVPNAQALRRDGGRVNDLLGVTGTLGDAGGALELLYAGTWEPHSQDHQSLRARLDRPTPRLAAGIALRSIARAAMDISDGLAGDIAHMMRDGLGAYIDSTSLPLSAELVRVMGLQRAVELALTAGDDYELLLAVDPAHQHNAERTVRATGTELTWIGHLTATGSVEIDPAPGALRSYQHF
jgi:thiamine-monophosphate kinase